MSLVYQVIKIESFSQMIPFFDFSVVEKIFVEAVEYNFIAMKIDHRRGVVVFGNNLGDGLIRDHLTNIAESLNKIRATIMYPPPCIKGR